MDAKDELRKDLNDHFSSLSLVSDLVGPPDRISVEFPDGDLYDVSVEDVAKHLTELGYVKVRRCKGCGQKEHHEPGMVWCPMVVGSWISEDGFCSQSKPQKEEGEE
jgi:hypothetical protein